jgi:glucokinase
VDFPFAAGVDIGGTHYAAGIAGRDGVLLAKKSRPIGAERPFEVIVKEIAETVLLTAEEAGLKSGQIAGTGFGVPSTINPRTKTLIFANNLSWLDRDLAGEYGKYISGPVWIENDAGCAAFGEVMTDPEHCDNALMITFGTGFGGGLIMNGKIFRGCDNFGIEPGHISLVYGGRKCSCGNSGCAEAYASVTALIERVREKMAACPDSLLWENCVDPATGRRDLARVDGHTPFAAARKGDKAALETLEEFTGFAGQAIANLITLFRPEKVIIGGGLCNEGGYFIGPLFEAAKARVFGGGLMPMPPFSKARLGNDAGIAGAALLAIPRPPGQA